MNNKPIRGFDVLGNIAIVKFSAKTSVAEKRKYAEKVMKGNNSITTILEKSGKFKGRLRKQTTKHVLGVKTKEVLYKENNCIFRFNVDDTYFSPRLSNERKEIAEKIKKGDKVLVMFAGVAPYSIVIAKNSGASRVYSNEINKKANEYAKMNIELNNVKNRVVLLPGDIKRIAGRIKEKFDVIVMPRPQLKDSFLKEAFFLSKSGKRGTRIYYYGFYKEEDIDSCAEMIKEEAMKCRKKIKILKIKKAGEVGARRFRVRVDFLVL